jgi:hypothetical protein
MGKGLRIVLSFVLVGILLIQSSWFFTAMFLMAGAMVFSGISGSWRDWFIWIGMLVSFALFAELRARMGPSVEAHPFFLYAIQLETLGGLIAVPTIWLQDHLQGGVLDAVATAVYLSFFFVPQIVVVYLWRMGGSFPRYVAAACLLFGTSLVVHFLVPTAPPWMASEEGLIPPMDRIAIRVLSATSATLTEGGYQASANDVAAMPSVHQGLTVLAMIVLAKHNPGTRWTGWVYCVLMLFAITYLGEHYAVDGLVGAAMAWGAWRIAGRLEGPFGRAGREADAPRPREPITAGPHAE